MSIRIRIILIVVPLFVFILILTSSISALTARTGLIELAVNGYSFKSNQFEGFIIDQWDLLVENDLQEDETFVASYVESLLIESKTLTKDAAEVIFAFNEKTFDIIFNTNENNVKTLRNDIETLYNQLLLQSPKEEEELQKRNTDDTLQEENTQEDSIALSSSNLIPRGWINRPFEIDGVRYVGYYFLFPTRDMVVVVSTTEKAFLKPVREIIFITLIIIIIAIFISSVVILSFSKTLIEPLKSMLKSMHKIIETNNFDERVEVKFRDEVGELSQTFNIMISELDRAYKQIKQYAFSAVVARKNESKIRNIFQKYVPANVINTLFQNTAKTLSGENRNLSLMFTDIRGFTTISERYAPDELVGVLNQYFEKLVDIITDNQGIIDKYIGDAIMAFFGAPVELKNSQLASVTAAIKMMYTLDEFNKSLLGKNLPPFITGIGINHGLVTVGNIGSEKKMDYTAIGDAVNLGSRLESLTKEYKLDLIFSHSVQQAVFDVVPCRLVDIVQVKGKTVGEQIYTTTPYVNDNVLNAYITHNEAVNLYRQRQFQNAKILFEDVGRLIPNDFLSKMYMERCEAFLQNPPDDDWDGTFIMTSK